MRSGSHVTIKDIAKSLGLSYSTVSLALNNASVVNDKTRERVQEYARSVRYRPNLSAKSIRTGHTRLIGAVLGRFINSFFEEITQGIENVAASSGYDVILNTNGSPEGTESELLERFIDRHVEGVITSVFSMSEDGIETLREVGIPVLLLRPDAEGSYPYVAVDNILGGRLAVSHLVELGHKHIIYVGYDSIYSHLRESGARAEAQSEGAYIEYCPVPKAIDRGASYDAIKLRIQAGLDFTAIFCADDVLSVGAIQALREADVSVPNEVSVVGFDDLRWAPLLSPPLTTIHQPQISQGEIAMGMLIDMMEGKPVQSRLLAPRLMVRGSTSHRKFRESLQAHSGLHNC